MRQAALLVVAFLSCRGEHPTFTCATSAQCGAGGVCIMAACAFADAACPSGYRWDVSAPGRARSCVEVTDMATPPIVVDDMAAALDQAAAIDLATPTDLTGGVHFYPDIEDRIEGEHCLLCHEKGGSVSLVPLMSPGDTADKMMNYNAMVSEVQTVNVLTILRDMTHCPTWMHLPCYVPDADLDVWKEWVANPVP
jgi:hypothetical protein